MSRHWVLACSENASFIMQFLGKMQPAQIDAQNYWQLHICHSMTKFCISV